MPSIHTTDNNTGDCKLADIADFPPSFHDAAGKSIGRLAAENPGLLVYPHDLKEADEKIDELILFELNNKNSECTLTTGNLCGIVGFQEEDKERRVKLHIKSRFDQSDEQFFLQYMLLKKFNPTVLKYHVNWDSASNFDLLPKLLFPGHLAQAMRKGMYRAYHRFNYNDANVRGRIDIARHMRENMPFAGKISYSMREFTHDNPINRLIRHTLYILEQDKLIPDKDKEFMEFSRLFKQNTPSWKPGDLRQLLEQTSRPVNHPLYTDYEPLRRLCRTIVFGDGADIYSDNPDENIFGVVVDMAWLWEEYLDVCFKENDMDLIHPGNRGKSDWISVFRDNNQSKRYPDFYNGSLVIDAKYKRRGSINPDDDNRMIVYLFLLRSQTGIFIYPNENTSDLLNKMGELNGYGGALYELGMQISSEQENFSDFCKEMKKSENDLCNWILHGRR